MLSNAAAIMAQRLHHRQPSVDVNSFSSVSSHARCVPCRDVREWIRSRRRTRDWAPDHDQDHDEEAPPDQLHCLARPKKFARSYYYSIFAARLAIMVMLTILIGLLTILTWHFTTVYTTRSIKSLALGLRTEILQRPISRMWNLLNVTLDTTMTQVNLSGYVIGHYPSIDSGKGQDQLLDVMRNITWAIFTSRKAVNAISIVYRNGSMQGFERDLSSQQTFYTYSVPGNETVLPPPSATGDLDPTLTSDTWVWYREPVDRRTGKPVSAPIPMRPYNLTRDLGGASLLRDGNAVWHVTVHGFEGSPFLASGSPVRHPDTGEVLAVAGVSQALTSISSLMKELAAVHSGTLYLTNDQGLLLASSTASPLLKNTSDGPALILAEESTDPIIQAGADWLRQKVGRSIDSLKGVHAEDIVLQGRRYYVDTFVLNLTQLPLVGVIITPRSYVLGAVDRRGHATLAILISISACILLVGCVFTLIFTSGVSTEMRLRAELIENLDARRRAEASSNYKSQFLANMSHELRTPMAAVIGLLDILLCDEYLSSEQVAMVSQIRHCSTALLRLLNNILDLSKVESGKLVLEEADFDLRRELEGLVDMFSVQCVDHSIDFVLDLADDIPHFLKGDSARTVQIFANLIANSIKFTSSGHVFLRGWCEWGTGEKSGLMFAKDVNNPWLPKTGRGVRDNSTQDEEKVYLWFEVDDSGCGIDPSKWETVFDSFVQADPSTTRTYGGTGLGLCIVRSLVNKMGGEIKVVRKDGPGTLMRLFLVFKQTFNHTPKNFSDYCDPTLTSDVLQDSRLLLSMQGDKGRSTMVRWMRKKGLNVCEALTWEKTMLELVGMLQDDKETTASLSSTPDHGSMAGCETETQAGRNLLVVTEPKEASSLRRLKVIPKTKPIALLDIGLLRNMRDLKELDHFTKQGVMIAWLLNHDTSSLLKGELRKLGFSYMVNKPIYNSKLVQLLKVMVGHFKDIESIVVDVGRTDASKFDMEVRDGLSPGSGRMEKVTRRGSSLPELQGTANVERSQSSQKLDQIVESPRHGEHCGCLQSHCGRPGQFTVYKATNYLQDLLGDAGKSVSLVARNEEVEGNLLPSFPKGLVNSDPQVDVAARVCPLGTSDLAPSDSDHLTLGTAAAPLTSVEQQKIPDRTNGGERGELAVSHPVFAGNGDDFGTSMADSKHIGGVDKVSDPKPVTLPQSVPARRVEKLSSNRIGPHDALKGIRILLAEDTPVLQRVATIILEKMGANVVAVGDGLQAVNALTKIAERQVGRLDNGTEIPDSATDDRELKLLDGGLAFDLVLMDCQMPKMDGYHATRAIREAEVGTGFHVPIVALTAHAMSSDEAKCLEVGMDAYLTKPIDTKLLVSTILSFTSKKE